MGRSVPRMAMGGVLTHITPQIPPLGNAAGRVLLLQSISAPPDPSPLPSAALSDAANPCGPLTRVSISVLACGSENTGLCQSREKEAAKHPWDTRCRARGQGSCTGKFMRLHAILANSFSSSV